ncbi:MAG: CbiX/SirB N-terminal domain-containing protein [Propionibacteriaceae bacterium]|nr:CbiX/SirB N-terminal domain-containing protein [Propionibacteriaceae bacterium]
MAAPAIVLIADADDDPAVAAALASLSKKLNHLRPDLLVTYGFLSHLKPSVVTSVSSLAARGSTEIVIVPLDLVSAMDHSPVISRAQQAVQAANQGVKVVIARPIGPATELLNVMDARMRDALHKTNAVEVDALVLGAPEGGDVRGTSLLARRARQWAAHHKLPVQLAVNDLTGRATALAIASLRTQGRRHIAVGSMFLTTGPLFRAHQQAAVRAGAMAVTDPIEDHDHLVELILARYAFAAMELLDASAPELDDTPPTDAD